MSQELNPQLSALEEAQMWYFSVQKEAETKSASSLWEIHRLDMIEGRADE